MADIVKGTNFTLVPEVDQQAASRADAQINRLVQKAAQAVETGNKQLLTEINKQIATKLGQDNPEVKVKVSYQTDSVTGQMKKVERLSASALDPMIKDYKKMIAVQGQSAIQVKQEIQKHKSSLATLRRKAALLKKQGKAYKKNLISQKKVVAETKRLEQVLARVSTLSSLKGQLRAESQKLSLMSQYTTGINKQGQIVSKVNKDWLAQRDTVKNLTEQVHAAGSASMGFGAKVAGLGRKMQAAFGALAAVAAGIAAITGAVNMLVGRAKDIQSLQLTFDGLGQSMQAQNDILSSAKRIALSYGVSLRKVEGAFRRLGPAILESGGTLADTENAIESISARTTMLGLNTEQAGRYIEAFAQVMGKGKLQSEELNQQFSELDGGLRGQLKNWLAANKGITDFEGAMKRGEITSGLFLEAFDAINEEIRTKFLRSIGDTQQAIEKMGEKGGMTLNQLNAKLQTLTTIGLEGVGKSLAPLGKELMKVYAAFIQVFTKISAEMPGVTALFQGLGHVIGVVIKVALNTVILGFGVLMKVIDTAVQGLMKLYSELKKIPVIGGMLQGLEDAGKALNRNFDQSIDIFSKLSDETTGAKTSLEQYSEELKNLSDQLSSGDISLEHYEKKVAEVEARMTESKRKSAQQQLDIEQEKFDAMLKMEKERLAREKQLIDRQIANINEAKETEGEAIDDIIEQLEKKKEQMEKVYDKKIEAVRRAHAEAKRAIDDERLRLNELQRATKESYDEKTKAVKDHYSKQREEMQAAHDAEMANIDQRISALKKSQSAQMSRLDNGPAKQNLERLKELELRKQLTTETDTMKRAEIRANLEAMQNSRKKAALEIQHAKQLEQAQKQKANLEKQQAAEKKKLDEEEKQRLKELQEAQAKTMSEIAESLRKLAGMKREHSREEKDQVQELKDQKKQESESYVELLEQQKNKRDEVYDAAEKRIDALNKKHDEEKRKIEDIEYEMKQVTAEQDNLSAAIDNTTNGALERQLTKVKTIKAEMAKLKSDGAGTAPAPEFRFAGGSVSGGTKYTVNELGTEGFLSASGKLSQINAPSFGTWKAPSAGTVIPAHIWKGIKASQQTSVTMPKMVNPGNGIARAISTINNTAGDHINNSVTIQAANPVQAANNMMVEMTRLKRRRFS